MRINQYLAKHMAFTKYDDLFFLKENAPRVKCGDGFSMSVQASKNHYCFPRKDVPFDRSTIGYTEVEVGYPSEYEAELMPYVEDEAFPLQTVYAYVPVKVVDAIIAKHGGIVED